MAWTAAPDGSNAFVNRRWAEYTGLSAQDTVGSGWQVAIDPEDVESFLSKWHVSLATGEPFEEEARFRGATDGEYRWFLARAVPLLDDQGNILRWYGILTDIEERKQAEALLAGEKRILEMVAKGDSLPDILDSICQLVEEHTRNAFTAILLVDGGRLRHVGKPSLPPAYVEAVDAVITVQPCWGSCGPAAYFARQVIVSDVMSSPLFNGFRETVLPLFPSLRAVWSSPIISSEGKVIGTFAMYYEEPRSPSPRDQQLIEQITHLAGVAIQARESERRYREVQMELTHANRVAALGQLTTSIAHEVNQPIAAAITNAQAALRWLSAETPDLEEVRKTLARIVKNGIRAGEIIGRIRALIKKAAPRKDQLDLNEALREVVALTHGELLKNDVSVRMELADDLPLIQGDRVQLQQVILNLIINAIEAMSGENEAFRDLALSTTRIEEAGAVHVTVRDSGPGLARLFWSVSLMPSIRPKRMVWGWGFRFAARSSKRTAGNCGLVQTYRAAPSSNSRCPFIRMFHRDDHAVGRYLPSRRATES
jgi:PAS domain S-box-containing protein